MSGLPTGPGRGHAMDWRGMDPATLDAAYANLRAVPDAPGGTLFTPPQPGP